MSVSSKESTEIRTFLRYLPRENLRDEIIPRNRWGDVETVYSKYVKVSATSTSTTPYVTTWYEVQHRYAVRTRSGCTRAYMQVTTDDLILSSSNIKYDAKLAGRRTIRNSRDVWCSIRCLGGWLRQTRHSELERGGTVYLAWKTVEDIISPGWSYLTFLFGWMPGTSRT